MSFERETILTLEATPVEFGAGASGDAGWELSRLGVAVERELVANARVAEVSHAQGGLHDVREGDRGPSQR